MDEPKPTDVGEKILSIGGKPIKEKKVLTSQLRENPWILSTIVLAVFVLVFFFGNFDNAGSMTGNVVSAEEVGANLLEFYSSQGGVEGLELDSVEEVSGLYRVNFLFEGAIVPIYVSMDGKYAGSLNLIPDENTPPAQNLNQQPPPADVPKLDKPEVELFIMSYCPYGTQAEKGILPVVALLGDKIDFKLRVVHYILHGEKEDLENKRELCIREEEGQDKLNQYLVCILDSDNPQEPGDVSACEREAGINSANLQTCLDTNAEQYFLDDSALSEGYGVRGSPTLIINGVQSNAGRSPASYLGGICAAFTNAPEECNEILPSASPSAGFGYNEGTDTVAQC